MRSGWQRVAARRCKPLHSKTDCRTLRCEGEFCTPQPKILARRGRRIPTTSSFLPATLRLTGGTDDLSRALRDVAARCRIAWLHQQNQHLFDFRSVPPFADLCRCLFGASKGQEKGNIRSTLRSGLSTGSATTSLAPFKAFDPFALAPE